MDSNVLDAYRRHQCYCWQLYRGCQRLRSRQVLWQLPTLLLASCTMPGTLEMLGKCWVDARQCWPCCRHLIVQCSRAGGSQESRVLTVAPYSRIQVWLLWAWPRTMWQPRSEHRIATFFWSLPAFLKQTALWTLSSCGWVFPRGTFTSYMNRPQKVPRPSQIWEWTQFRFV